MFSFSNILRDLQAVIAAKAARERALTVLLVAVWGRVARMRTRLERLVALWRSGTLPKARAPRGAGARVGDARATQRLKFPTSQGWLSRKLGYEVVAFRSQLTHLLTEAECAAFLEACPQAGRVLRPLLRMLTFDPPPEVVRVRAKPAVPVAATVVEMVGGVVGPAIQFSRG